MSRSSDAPTPRAGAGKAGCPLLPLLFISIGAAGCFQQPPPPPPEMVSIPAGAFIRGSDKVDAEHMGSELGSVKPWYLDEHPQHQESLHLFFIDRTEVTNAQYKVFIDATGARPPLYFYVRSVPPGRENYPVTDVSWYEADHYCRWAGKRLPTEAEWEKAARGTDGREFPWGNAFDPKKANVGDSGVGDVAPVGSYKEGASPYGVMDMAGNVWEWTDSWYQSYPGGTYPSPLFGEKQKVFRGGGWGGTGHYALPLFYRTAYRSSLPPEEGYADLGFRCAKSPG